MSRTGTSTPELTNAAAAASSRASSLRRASARFRGAGDPDPLLMPTTPLRCPWLHLANGTVFRMVINGTTIRLARLPREESIMQYRTLGRTGVQVSTLVLGAMNFGSL